MIKPLEDTPLNARQLSGLDERHLVKLPSGHRLLDEVAEAYSQLKRDAATAGFELAIASSYRSFSRQLTLWNSKARGERPVFNDAGEQVDVSALQPLDRLYALLRFSAIPGSSRHHWGTDLDVYDSAVMPEDYTLQLSLDEVAPGGMFDELHCWLDERMAAGQSHGFYRPYAVDRGGVSPERWHLSYAPIAQHCERCMSCDLLCAAWDSYLKGAEGGAQGGALGDKLGSTLATATAITEQDRQLLLQDVIIERLPELFERYIAVPDGWCD